MKQEEKKPQEFWIYLLKTSGRIFCYKDPQPYKQAASESFDEIHAIEYRVYKELQKENEKLKAELDKCTLNQIDFLIEHPTYKLSKELEKENEQLKAKLEKAKQSLRFYSLKSNYSIVDEGRNYSVDMVCYELDEVTYEDTELGTRARAALKEIEGES